jgi:hypothetical protein
MSGVANSTASPVVVQASRKNTGHGLITIPAVLVLAALEAVVIAIIAVRVSIISRPLVVAQPDLSAS